jgi:hypothetical protein
MPVCSRVDAVRHALQPVPGCVGMLTLCRQLQHNSQQIAANSCIWPKQVAHVTSMLSDIVPGWMCSVGLNDLAACNLTSTTCCTNPVHAAVIRIACSAAATAQSEQQNKVEYMCMLVRVLMRSDTMEPVPGCVGNTALHKPCAARNNTKPDGSKQ